MPGLAESTLNALRIRIAETFPMQVRTALEAIPEEQIWWRPNEGSNSAGNLVLHLSGSLNHYLNLAIGGIEYKRDREGEFAARGPMKKDELLRIFDAMVTNADTTLRAIDPQQLSAPSTDPERYDLLVEDLISIATHFSTHVGQILWIAKATADGVLNEEWMRAHKHSGAWKR